MLGQHSWPLRFMVIILDTLHAKMNLLKSETMKIIDRNFIPGLLDELRQDLPPLQEHYEYFYNKKNRHKVAREKIKYQPNQALLYELFSPSNPINLESYFIMEHLCIIVAEILTKEFDDRKKATHNYLCVIDGMCS